VSNGVDPTLRVRMLGGFSVRRGEVTLVDSSWSRNRAAALIKMLALQPGRALHREQVLDLLWPDLDPTSAANNLHKNVHYIRSELERHGVAEPMVTLSGGVVALDRHAVVDVDEFRAAARAARAARTNPLLYAEAFELHAGELLPLDRFEPWASAPRDEINALHARLVLEMTQLHEVRGEWRAALECLARLGPRHTDEEAYRTEMRIHALSGNQDAALLAYERCRDALADELGVAPSRRTETLRSDIAHGRARRRARLSHIPEDPLVGRADEMARVIAALNDAFEGSGGLVLISGEPGIGKTRLAEEVAVHAHLRGAHVLWGRCDPGDAAPAFGPWIQAIQIYIEEASGRAGATLDVPGLTAPAASSAEAGQQAQGRKRLFESVITLFKLAADSRSVLLVIDDLHDADVASLELLRHLAREAPSMRMLIIGTFRDTELEPDHPLTRALGELVREHLRLRIDLRGLSEGEVQRFVEITIGPGTASADVHAIHDETDGNPYFVKECALALRDVPRRRARAGFRLPPNARDAVLRRVDRMSPECRDVLASASTIGRRFDRALLVRVSSMPHAEVLDALDEAVRAHIITACEEGDDAWMFAHGLTQQAIYERIGARRRADLHGRVAVALESRVEADPAELAHHFVEAARGGGDAEKAIGYSLKAGEAALARFAWESAIAHWETASHLMQEHNADIEQCADLLERLEMLIFNTGGEHGAVLRHLEQALVLRQALGQEEKVAQVHSRLGRALSTHVGNTDYTRHMNFERALEHYRAAEPVLTRSDDKAALAYFYSGMAGTAFNAVNVADGIIACERGIEIAASLHDPSQEATLVLLKGGFMKLQGKFRESTALMTRAYALGDRENNPLVTFFAVTNMGDWTEGYVGGRGDLFESELQHPRMASGPQRLGLLGDLARMACRNGDVAKAKAIAPEVNSPSLTALIAYCEGDMHAAERDLAATMDALRQVGHRNSYANRAHLLAEVKMSMDDLTSAEGLLRDELAIGLDGGSVLLVVRASAELAMICVLTDRLEEADALLACCREALASGEDWGRRAGHTLLAEAMLATAQQRDADAQRSFAEALTIFRERKLAWDEADVYLHMAGTLRGRGARKHAEEMREHAREIYERIGAGPAWLQRTAVVAQ
jgi:DNA-binding SARP family transcriptional activator/tetratricopeptide (TPR) repeat protein